MSEIETNPATPEMDAVYREMAYEGLMSMMAKGYVSQSLDVAARRFCAECFRDLADMIVDVSKASPAAGSVFSLLDKVKQVYALHKEGMFVSNSREEQNSA